MSETFETYEQASLWDTSTFTSSQGSADFLSAWQEQDTPHLYALSQAAFPVRISATQENRQELPEQEADYGQKCTDSFATYDQITSSWRTWQLSFTGELIEYSETYPKSGMMRNGQLYQHVQWVPHTCEKECSSWPTPDVNMSRGGYEIGQARRLAAGQLFRPSGARIGTSLKWTPRLIPDYEKTGGGLNPIWIEWLQGYPEGWTDLKR